MITNWSQASRQLTIYAEDYPGTYDQVLIDSLVDHCGVGEFVRNWLVQNHGVTLEGDALRAAQETIVLAMLVQHWRASGEYQYGPADELLADLRLPETA